MSMLLLLTIGCSNLTPREWTGGGTRYASGHTTENGDTAAIDTADTAVDGALALGTASAVYKDNEAGDRYIQAGIAYTAEPDNLNGGRLYYTILADAASVEEGSRGLTEGLADESTQAALANGQITFQVGPVETGVSHELVVHVVDRTVVGSNEVTIPVTGP